MLLMDTLEVEELKGKLVACSHKLDKTEDELRKTSRTLSRTEASYSEAREEVEVLERQLTDTVTRLKRENEELMEELEKARFEANRSKREAQQARKSIDLLEKEVKGYWWEATLTILLSSCTLGIFWFRRPEQRTSLQPNGINGNMIDHESELVKHSRDQEAATTPSPTKQEWAEFLRRFQALEDTIPMIRDYLSKSESKAQVKKPKANNDGEDVLEEPFKEEVEGVASETREVLKIVDQQFTPSREAGEVVAKPKSNSIEAKAIITQVVAQPQDNSEHDEEVGPQSDKAMATEAENLNRAEARHHLPEEINGKQSGDKVPKMTSGKAQEEPKDQVKTGAKEKKKKI